MKPVAVIVGGAESVWDEVTAAEVLCAEAGVAPAFFYCNSMIASFPKEGVAVSLHPWDIDALMVQRRLNRYPEPKAIWSNIRHKSASHWTTDKWGASCGFFAVQVAIHTNVLPIMLCGVPMELRANHYKLHQPWTPAEVFWRYMAKHAAGVRPFVRSFSGKTMQTFGRPTVEFLQQEHSNAAHVQRPRPLSR